ncbi:MAG: peptide chain release factor 2 [Acholeplasmatales bacterium]|nr:peptide chain release factor 2 [Acholeplasmatales bacterium]
MEKYELNKFINEYKKRVSDLNEALQIDDKKKQQEKLALKMAEADFWNDPSKANEIINESNSIRNDIESYDEIDRILSDILEMSKSDDEELQMLLEEEIEELKDKVSEFEKRALLNGKYDNSNCILELHPGAGGTESMDWALMLFRMYQRFSTRRGYKFEVLDYQAGDEAGIKSVTVLISGEFAYGYLKSERGVHRLVRISPFDANKRRHTSFCSCDIAPQINDNSEIEIKDEDIRIDVFHSSGAGGQSVNTTDSAVRITHFPTNIVVTCQNERSQLQNKEMCFKILRSKLLELELKKREEELKKIRGESMKIDFGSQIRSYVFTPYTLVKDHRTEFETSNVAGVMDGNLLPFMEAYLKFNAGE